jgi:hypothetical protein
MKQLSLNGCDITIVEISKTRFKAYVNSSYLNMYETEEKALEAAKKHVTTFMKGEKE